MTTYCRGRAPVSHRTRAAPGGAPGDLKRVRADLAPSESGLNPGRLGAAPSFPACGSHQYQSYAVDLAHRCPGAISRLFGGGERRGTGAGGWIGPSHEYTTVSCARARFGTGWLSNQRQTDKRSRRPTCVCTAGPCRRYPTHNLLHAVKMAPTLDGVCCVDLYLPCHEKP